MQLIVEKLKDYNPPFRLWRLCIVTMREKRLFILKFGATRFCFCLCFFSDSDISWLSVSSQRLCLIQ